MAREMGQTCKVVAEEIIKQANIDFNKIDNHKAHDFDKDIKNDLGAMRTNSTGKNYNFSAFKSLLKK